MRIERDPETGAILQVLEQDVEEVPQVRDGALAPLNDPLAALEDGQSALVDQHHISGHVGRGIDTAAAAEDPSFLARFAADAARPGGRKIRKQSEREQDWCRILYEKHGQDWDAMFKDSKLNVMQQSEGELKKKVGKWLKEGGKHAVVAVEAA